MVEMAKYDTKQDRVDHIAVGDYKRVWAIVQERPVDYAEGIAREDATEATFLPYALSVADDWPLIFSDEEYPDALRTVLMQQLESNWLGRLPRKAKCGENTGVGNELVVEEGEEDEEESEEGEEEWVEEMEEVEE